MKGEKEKAQGKGKNCAEAHIYGWEEEKSHRNQKCVPGKAP